MMLAGIPWAITSLYLTEARVLHRHVATVVITLTLTLAIIVPALILVPGHGPDTASNAAPTPGWSATCSPPSWPPSSPGVAGNGPAPGSTRSTRSSSTPNPANPSLPRDPNLWFRIDYTQFAFRAVRVVGDPVAVGPDRVFVT